jgi:hypothetical protein
MMIALGRAREQRKYAIRQKMDMNDESKMTIAVAVTFIILETAKFLIYEY